MSSVDSPSSVPLTVQRALDLAFRRRAKKVALRHGDVVLTYEQLDAKASALAKTLLACGLTAGDRVAVMLPNCTEYVLIAIACAKVSLCMVPMNYRFRPQEVKAQAEDAGVKAFFFDELFSDTVTAASLEPSVQMFQRGDSFEQMISNAPADVTLPPAEEQALFYLGYTSGTTGKPKGALINQRNRALAYHYWALEFGIGPDDISLHSGPFHHTAPFTFTLTQLFMGGEVIILDAFDSIAANEAISVHGVTWAFMVPYMLDRVLETAINPESAPRLRMLISGASALPTRTKERLLERLPGLALHEFYGATEAGTITNLRPEFMLTKTRCVGQPIAEIEIQIRDESGLPVSQPGEIGDIWLRGPTLFAGYFNDPIKTREVTDGTWCTLGDIGYLDDEGFLFLVDRRKNVIKSGGVNIYPIEIEEVILRDTEVRECAVAGLPDERWGEAACAFLVLHPSADPGVVTKRLQEMCSQALADFKRPKSYRCIEALPRNANGKILTRELRTYI